MRWLFIKRLFKSGAIIFFASFDYWQNVPHYDILFIENVALIVTKILLLIKIFAILPQPATLFWLKKWGLDEVYQRKKF